MATLTGSTNTYLMGTGGGLREDLEDKIWDLFADDTWAISNLPKVPATGTYHEWETDVLVAATTNRHLEGESASASTIVAPTRAGNYCQISNKVFLVSGTLEAVKKAGRAREAARQTVKQMRELKNEMEYAVVRNQASAAGDTGSARSLASMESWIATNEEQATSSAGASTTGFSGGLVTAPTDGSTTGTLSETTFTTMLGDAWTYGGDARIVLVGNTQKKNIDTFSGIATRFVNVNATQQAPIVGAADMYRSSYGNHTIVLHRHVRSSVVLGIDPGYWAIATLRNPFIEQLAKTGDGTQYQIVTEFTLVCRNEKASAKVSACA